MYLWATILEKNVIKKGRKKYSDSLSYRGGRPIEDRALAENKSVVWLVDGYTDGCVMLGIIGCIMDVWLMLDAGIPEGMPEDIEDGIGDGMTDDMLDVRPAGIPDGIPGTMLEGMPEVMPDAKDEGISVFMPEGNPEAIEWFCMG